MTRLAMKTTTATRISPCWKSVLHPSHTVFSE